MMSLACGSREMPPPFPLTWAPSSTPRLTEQGERAFGAKTFRLEAVVDRRADPAKVGVETDEQRPFRTTTNVAAFCTDHVRELIAGSGMKLTDDGQYVVQGELEELLVKEGSRFDGEVRIKFRVFTIGQPAFEQTYIGSGSTFGGTHNPENVNEALSQALLSAVSQFLHDDKLIAYFQQGAPTPPPPSAPAPSAPAPAPAPTPSAAQPKMI